MGEWRFLGFQVGSAFSNMALDEAILLERLSDRVSNTVRLYGWSPSAVSVGRFQNVEQEVNLENCRRFGVDVVRRMSGGGAVYHDSEGEITYCIVSRTKDLAEGDLANVYAVVYRGIVEALRILGITADFNSGDARNCPNLTVGGRKISGSSQMNRGGFVLQHGTLLLKADLEKMFTVLRVPWAKTCMEVVGVAKRKITSVQDELGVELMKERVSRALRSGFEIGFGCQLVDGHLTSPEQVMAEELCNKKYATCEWNVSGKCSFG